MSTINQKISEARLLHVQQVFEAWELLGFETRNKYKILNESNELIAYAAEKSTGMGGAIVRHFLGHWRKFDVVIYDADREAHYKLHFPFRWFFKTIYVSDAHGRRVGHLQERFAIFRKKFDAFDVSNQPVAQINSSFFRFWTFDFMRG